ncbi:hypothetical protein ACWCZ5_12325 [Streptomyces sp. NPDC001667]
MTRHPPTKSLPVPGCPLGTAVRTSPPPDAVRPKGDAEGVLSALPFTFLTEDEARYDDGRRPVAWLHVHAPQGATPTATSVCGCGRDRSAAGYRQVLDLITDHTAHRGTCPLRTPREGRTA